MCFEQNAREIIYFKISLHCLFQFHNVNGLIFLENSTDCSNYLTSKRKLLEQYHALKEETLVENYLAMHYTFI